MAKPVTTRMSKWFPTTSHPLIVSAPMLGVTNARLAAEVTKAGGLGFIQGGREFAPDSPELKKLDEQLALARSLLSESPETNSSQGPLPLGVGFLAYTKSAAHFPRTVVPILQKHRPAAVWLFAPHPDVPGTLGDMIAPLRAPSSSSWTPRVAVQVGTVAAAREAVRHGADVVVAQGTDAGGHQFARGAAIVSLVPEIVDMLREEFADREVAVWAAGGIADGRGVAAALALGAEGAVLGTRYMVATESDAQDFKRRAILSTSDGGTSTVKSQLHDHIQSNYEWPELYDGRAIVHPSYSDHVSGVSLDDNLKRYKAAKDEGDLSRMVTWSGTGVGLIRQELPAIEITRRVREEALRVITGIKSNI
ncbi:FMN-dependent 2-nitropropane dioxygenase [Biscogniauxia sp. FL1348]|nr:FMN-dependent 2-nitropropane dioxygenase [Biscogniauxia sp. FL1348]